MTNQTETMASRLIEAQTTALARMLDGEAFMLDETLETLSRSLLALMSGTTAPLHDFGSPQTAH